jgi:phosphoglycerate dehydrogenase-like enzyme
MLRASLGPRLPEWIEPRWWGSVEELHALAPEAEIGWFDMHVKPPMLQAVALATRLRWLSSAYAGVDFLPLAELDARGCAVTCGSGLTATQVAEFAVLSILAVAKNYPALVRAQDERRWLVQAPGIRELASSKALVLGAGTIGRKVAAMLRGFEVAVSEVRRRDGDAWRAQLGTFEWIVLAVPGTGETRGMIGAAEIAAMKPEAVLVNVARADVVDQAALIEALRENRIAAAVLDVTDPEPLPPDHPLWDVPTAHITMHLSGIPTPASIARAADRFLANCDRFRAGERLEAQVDPVLGY